MMQEKKIIFILTYSANTNSLKRIDEFVSWGYQVRAYGFNRDIDVLNKPKYVDVDILDCFKNNLSYFKRLPYYIGESSN